ncbi:MAG TPA: ElyC/SanA/YdcF family protein [Anaerolineales bacterium]|nr:ElyC/SanA/YdcF family protein [Anaerolineales bacterium]
MRNRFIKHVFRLIQVIVVTGASALLLSRLLALLSTGPRQYNLVQVPARPAAVVFGAGLWRDGSPTPVLRDRVATAAELYFSGKVEKILMSGDNRVVEYNEPAAMRTYALSLGVPDEAIVLDYAGRSTYDTCYRAGAIFGLHEVILVTQKFHMPRAIYTCQALGLDPVGVAADRRDYRRSSQLYWNLRELPATLNALFEVHLLRPLPVLGNPEPIFPDT